MTVGCDACDKDMCISSFICLFKHSFFKLINYFFCSYTFFKYKQFYLQGKNLNQKMVSYYFIAQCKFLFLHDARLVTSLFLIYFVICIFIFFTWNSAKCVFERLLQFIDIACTILSLFFLSKIGYNFFYAYLKNIYF